MPSTQFKLSIGAKRQLTIPRECMELLSLKEGNEILLDVSSDHATLTPMITLPRSKFLEQLRQTSISRMGAKPTDVPLAQLLEEMGYKPQP